MAVCVEHVDKAVARTRHVVMLLRILLRISHEELAIDVLDAKRREAGRDIRIREASVGRRGYE
jgi:hypothetical protein